jgi:hypothetical protein
MFLVPSTRVSSGSLSTSSVFRKSPLEVGKEKSAKAWSRVFEPRFLRATPTPAPSLRESSYPCHHGPVKIVLACLVTALVTAGGTEAAHRLITSKDIKNGTIRPVDLSASVRRPDRVKIRAFASFSYLETQPKTVTALCPADTMLLGGGFSTGPESPGQIVVFSSEPTQGLDGWQATGQYRNGNFLNLLNVYALCERS